MRRMRVFRPDQMLYAANRAVEKVPTQLSVVGVPKCSIILNSARVLACVQELDDARNASSCG